MRTPWAFWLLGLATILAGCQQNTSSQLASDIQLPRYQERENSRFYKLAETQWALVAKTQRDRNYSAEYAEGFKDGFTDHLGFSGSGHPPQYYWKARNRTPESAKPSEDWLAGFRHGGSVAAASGHPDRPTAATGKAPSEDKWFQLKPAQQKDSAPWAPTPRVSLDPSPEADPPPRFPETLPPASPAKAEPQEPKPFLPQPRFPREAPEVQPAPAFPAPGLPLEVEKPRLDFLPKISNAEPAVPPARVVSLGFVPTVETPQIFQDEEVIRAPNLNTQPAHKALLGAPIFSVTLNVPLTPRVPLWTLHQLGDPMAVEDADPPLAAYLGTPAAAKSRAGVPPSLRPAIAPTPLVVTSWNYED